MGSELFSKLLADINSQYEDVELIQEFEFPADEMSLAGEMNDLNLVDKNAEAFSADKSEA